LGEADVRILRPATDASSAVLHLLRTLSLHQRITDRPIWDGNDIRLPPEPSRRQDNCSFRKYSNRQQWTDPDRRRDRAAQSDT
jgi:hypothetical protein